MARWSLSVVGSAVLAATMIGTPGAAPLSVLRLPDAIPLSTRVPTGTALVGPRAVFRFCHVHPEECQDAAGPDVAALDEAAWQELATINHDVNAAIQAAVDTAGDTWTLGVRVGDCDDYAVQKRHDLISRGWPSRAVRLAVVRTRRNTYHLVVLVRTNLGDYVLDNLSDRVLPWNGTEHRLVMVSNGADPRRWNAASDVSLVTSLHGDERRQATAKAGERSRYATAQLRVVAAGPR